LTAPFHRTQSYEERSYWLIYLRVDPALDPLRTRPRFVELLRKVFGRADARAER